MQGIVSVVIPVHNAATVIGEQLEALASQIDAPAFEVVVILNRCTDDSGSVADSFSDRLTLSVFKADTRASAAHARNVGASLARGDVLLFCDADDRVGTRWVAGLVEAIAQTGVDFVGGPVVVDRRGLPDWAYYQFYEWFDGLYLKPSPNGFIRPLGGSLGVTRTAFEHVGGFDESLPGCEDSDFTYRLLRDGLRVGVAPDALLTVRPRISTRSLARQQCGHAPGTALQLAKEHRLAQPPPYFEEYIATLRWLAFLIVRRRTWRPSELYVRFMARRSKEKARRRTWRQAISLPGSAAPDSAIGESDFVVPPITPVIGGLGFRVSAAQARWWATSGVDQASLWLLPRLLREGDLFVDVGANIGVFSVCAAKLVGSGGHVIAFEPHILSRSLLHQNLTRHAVNAVVEVRQVGAGAAFHRPSMFERHDNALPSRLAGNVRAAGTAGPGAATAINVVTLDNSIHGAVRFLRLAVEGFEVEVLHGSTALFDRSPDAVLLLECNPVRLASAGSSLRELLKRLPSHRWRLWLIDEHSVFGPRAAPLDDDSCARIESAPRDWCGNLLAAPLHRAHEVEHAVQRLL